MSETDATNRFTLTPEQPTGTVGLPSCKLVLHYQHGSGELSELAVSTTPLKVGEEGGDLEISPDLVTPEIKLALIDILKRIPCMEEKGIRNNLLWLLKPEEKDIVKPRFEDMIEDLKCIVEGMTRLGKLCFLISTVKRRPMSTALRDRLDRIFERLVSQKYSRYEETG